MRDTLIVINSFVHDMATGVWVAVLFMMYIISSRAKAVMALPQVSVFIAGIMDRLWLLAIASVIVVIITGIIRGFTFKYYGWTGDVARGRRHLLLIKHAILSVLVAAGLYVQFVLIAKV